VGKCESPILYSWKQGHLKLKIFITGGRGRLARSLSPLLSQQGHQIKTFSRNANAQNLPLTGFGREFERNPADVILHLAWSTVPATAELEPGIEWREDLPLLSLIGAQILRQKKTTGRAPLLVFFSSCSVYGGGRLSRPFRETDPMRPIGWYARGKLEAERLLSYYHEAHGLPILVLRISNPYGFGQDEKTLQGVIPALLRCGISGRPFRQWGDGKAMKDFLHIQDLFGAIQQCLRKKIQGTFNICSGHPVSLSEVIRKTQQALSKKIVIQEEKKRSWDVRQASYSPLRIQRATGWAPGINLEQGLEICRQAIADSQEKKI
jgi:UDP-glucose 4-epimerase